MFENKIKGCLFGYAIGDALGLGTEFMSRQEVAMRYPDGLHDYQQIIRDAHRSQWRKGDYTSDTRFVTLLAGSIIEKSDIDHLDYARKLKEWYATGKDFDCGPHLRLVIQHPDFTENPHEVAKQVYDQRGLPESPNESLGRAMLLGLWPGVTEETIIRNCTLTHPSVRCITSSIIIAKTAKELLWYRRQIDFDHLVGIAQRLSPDVIPYLEVARSGKLEDFHLDDTSTLWYARKAMGAALWGLWHHTSPRDALYEVVAQGGDADTNSALTMGLMGLKYGYNSLPAHLTENLLGKDHIMDLSEKLIHTLREADKSKDTDE